MIEAVIEILKKHNISNYEILKKKIGKIKLEVFKGKLEDFKKSEEVQLSVRLIKDKRIGFFYLSGDISEKVLENAIKMVKFVYKDEFNSINNEADKIDVDDTNKKIQELTEEKMLEFSLNIEDAAYKKDKRIVNVKNAGVEKGDVEILYLNSYGAYKRYKSNYVGASVVAVAQDGNESYMGYEYALSRKFDISFYDVGAKASEKATRMFGAKKGKSMKCPVVFENELVGDLLAVISSSFFLENIEKRKSMFFKNSKGDKIASSIITLVDDGSLKGYNGTVAFDDEGVSTKRTYLIENGVLGDFLNNSYYAKKFGKSPTGNGFKPSFKSPPSISITNLILKNGDKSLKEGIESIKQGIYITNIMGIHTANPISGDFSLGFEGIIIENGSLTYPVREMVISGNIKDILKNTAYVFDDTKSNGSIYSPSILVEGLTISG